jgi:hypothetical protein
VTIDDHAADAWLDCRDDRGDPSGKGARRRYSPFAPTSRLPGASTSPPPFRNDAADGVFAPEPDGRLRFHRLPAPVDADIARLAAAIARRIGRLLARRGLTADADAADPLAVESLALASLASAAVQGRLALAPRAGMRVERLGHHPDAPWIESSRPLQARCDYSATTPAARGFRTGISGSRKGDSLSPFFPA